MRLYPRRKARKVVPALQHRNRPARRAAHGPRHICRNPPEIRRFQPHAAQRVVFMGIEPGGEDEQFGLISLQRRDDLFLVSRMEGVAPGACGQGDVENHAPRIAVLRRVAGAGIERRLVGRCVKHVRAAMLVNHVRRAVAVMHVEIHDGDARKPVRRNGMPRRDIRVGQKAESHRLFAARMVPRRAHRAEHGIGFLRHHHVHPRHARTRRQPRRGSRPRRNHGVEIDIRAAFRGRPLLQRAHMGQRVGAGNLHVGGGRGFYHGKAGQITRQHIHDGGQAGRALGVARAGIVLDARRVGDNDDFRMKHKAALILGITGQDGSYLAELLLSKACRVHGLVRRTAHDNRTRIRHLLNDVTLHEGDMADAGSLWRIIASVQPDEVYNLAAQSHVHTSFAEPEHTGSIDALGCVRVMDALRTLSPRAKFYQASTSELFGQGGGPFDESSPMQPASPYGAAKLYAFHMLRIYRQAYGLFACNGILFNHESPRRGGDFVTAKIARFARSYRDGNWNGAPLLLGNLDARRDWGHARDYVEGMWRMLQHDHADDYVLATGESHSVRDFVNAAIPGLSWAGDVATDGQGRAVAKTDPALVRPVDVPELIGNAAKAKTALGWQPRTRFAQLVTEMVETAS